MAATSGKRNKRKYQNVKNDEENANNVEESEGVDVVSDQPILCKLI